MRKLIVIASLLLVISQDLFAATYWAKTTGSDTTGDGSEGNPFLTIQKAIDAMSSGSDDVCVGNGNYTQGFLLAEGSGDHSGTAENYVTIKNCEGGVVSIDSSEHIASWSSLGGNKYESNTLTFVNPLWFWKDTTWLNTKQTTCDTVDSEGEWCDNGSTIIIYTASDPTGFTYRSADENTIEIRDIAYVEIENIDVYYAIFAYQIGTSFTAPLGPTNNIIIRGATTAYLGNRGIRLIGTNADPTTDIRLTGGTVFSVKDNTGGSNGHCIKFDSNEVGTHNYDSVVDNYTVYDCWSSGIQISTGWASVIAENNTIYDTSAKASGYASGVRCGAPSSIVRNNHIYADSVSLGSGVYVQEDATCDVNNNLIHGFDWHGIYVFSVTAYIPQADIWNNIIYDNDVSGIRIDKTQSIYVDNNTIIDSGSSSSGGGIDLNLSTADGVYMRNNIVSSSNKLALRTVSGSTIAEDSNNIFWRGDGGNLITLLGSTKTFSQYQASGYGLNSKNQDPLLDTAGNLYVPLALSPARNSGKPLKSIFTTDYDGTARGNTWDMGAHEVSTEVIFDGITIN